LTSPSGGAESRGHEPVRDLHDEAARDPNLAVASVRPLGTTRFELWLMVRDVLRKLDVDENASVLEVGCGVGVLGLPLARRVRRYVGIDIAETALAVFGKRLASAGLDDRASLRPLDFAAAPAATGESLGRFDRVLVYAVLHYVATEMEGQTFVAQAIAALEPGGKALFGNLPLADLAGDLEPQTARRQGSLRRAGTALRAALAQGTPNAVGIVQTRRARLVDLVFGRSRLLLRPVFSGARTAPSSLPSGSTVDLSKYLVEDWLEKAPIAVQYRWLPPGVATPLAHGRADLLVIRAA
jgi:2-polyprenyl-3-methyl-5-hydroxy-6-metoxy-1,4-benzoquinol methylase